MRLTRWGREGLVRAIMGHKGAGFDSEKWSRKRLEPHAMGAAKNASAEVGSASDLNDTVLPDLKMAEMLACRVRYFTSGAVIGSKMFVNEVFSQARERFGAKRKGGARAPKGEEALKRQKECCGVCGI